MGTTVNGSGGCLTVDGGIGPSSIPGVPASLLAQVRGPIEIEHFCGVETASRSEKQFVTTSTGGAVVSVTNSNPTAGDTVTVGQCRVTLTRSAVAQLGLRRSTVSAIASDGFGTARPTLFAKRFRMDSAKPAATDYESFSGIFRYPTAEVLPLDGVGLWFDPTLGIDAWVIRALRAGVPIQSVAIGAFDAAYHVAGFLHTGTAVIPFFDGVAFASFTGAEIQPAVVCAIHSHAMITLAGATIDPDETVDWVAWGR